MSWLEVALVTLLTATILAAWSRHALETRLWLRVAHFLQQGGVVSERSHEMLVLMARALGEFE